MIALICGSPLNGLPRGVSLRDGPAHEQHMSVPVQVDVEEIEDGGIAEPDPGVGDNVQAAAEAVATAEQPERELHSFEIDPAQVDTCAQPASEYLDLVCHSCIHCSLVASQTPDECISTMLPHV